MIMDQTTTYMNNLHLPKHTQHRVKDWLNFTWRQQNTFDELAILSALPNKATTDISLNLHLEMLKQVELFHCVERPVICELVNFLRPILFLPGDFIFRKEDIGNSMYIVNKGVVEVFADREGMKLLVTLGKGLRHFAMTFLILPHLLIPFFLFFLQAVFLERSAFLTYLDHRIEERPAFDRLAIRRCSFCRRPICWTYWPTTQRPTPT